MAMLLIMFMEWMAIMTLDACKLQKLKNPMKMVRLLNYNLSMLTLKFQEPECKIEVPSDEAANPPSSLNELSSQGKFK